MLRWTSWTNSLSLCNIKIYIDTNNIPFKTLIKVPTNSGNQLKGPFRGKFDYMVLICPTFVHNKTYDRFVDHDSRIFVTGCQQEEVELWLKLSSHSFQGMNTLIILDNCAASKDVKGRTGQLASLGFLAVMEASAFGFWRSRSPASQNHSAKTWPPLFFFIPRWAKPWQTSLRTISASFVHKSTRNWWQSWKRKNFTYLLFALRHPFRTKILS